MALLKKAAKKNSNVESTVPEENRKTLRRDLEMSNEFEKTESLCKNFYKFWDTPLLIFLVVIFWIMGWWKFFSFF